MAIAFDNPKIAEEIKNYFLKNVVKFEYVEEAFALFKNYQEFLATNPDFSNTDPDLFKMYSELMVLAKFVAIPMLGDEEIINLFKDHAVEVINIPDRLSLWKKLRAKLVAVGELSDRDVLKEKIKEALEQNNQNFLVDSIKIGGELLPASVSNWLKNVNVEVGRQKADPFKFNEYIVSNINTAKLSNEQREKLRELIQFYYRLQLSSLSFEGLEDTHIINDGGKRWIFNDGTVEQITDKDYEEMKQISEKAIKYWNEFYGDKDAAAKSSVEADNLVNENYKPVGLKESALVDVKKIDSTHILKAPISTFSFDQENDKDVKRRESMVSHWQEEKTIEQEVRVLAEEVIKQHNFSFKDEVNKKRFVNLFVSRVKNVRSVVEVRETLLKSQEAGGLGLTSDKVDSIVKIIEGAKKDFEARSQKGKKSERQEVRELQVIKPMTELDKLVAAEAVGGASLKQLSKSQEANKAEGQGVKESESRGVVGLKSQPTKMPEPIKVAPKGIEEDKLKSWREEMLKEIAKVAPPPPAPERKIVEDLEHDINDEVPSGGTKQIQKISINIPTASLSDAVDKKDFMGVPLQPSAPRYENSNVKPILADIKAPPRVVGPIEELKALTLVDLRRMGDTAAALNKIKGMVDLIGEHSVTKRLEAVKAWQVSPLYQQYVKLGHDSIVQGKGMADLANSVEGGLTEKEFNAIADFNVRLRF